MLHALLKQVFALFALLLGACVAWSPMPPAANTAQESSCAAWLEALSHALPRSPDAIVWGTRHPDHPLFRGGRVLDAWPERLAPDAKRQWLQHALDKALVAWDAAMAGQTAQETAAVRGRLHVCGALAVAQLLDDPVQFDALRQDLRAGDDYRAWARWLGAYPLAVPAMRWGIAAWRAEAQQRFASGLGGAFHQRYLNGPTPRPVAEQVQASASRLPGLAWPDTDRLQALIDRHAPQWRLATQGRNDRPGALGFSSSGQVIAKPEQPTVYVQASAAWLLGQPRLQLVYTLWLPARTAAGPLDPYAGRLDGVTWRVTLDHDGRALAHDTIHPCGCFHMVFPVVPLAARAGSVWQEAPLVPGRAPPGRLRIDLSAGDHQVIGVSAADPSSGGVVLDPRAYTELLAVPHPGPGPRRQSVFGPDGRIPGTQRAERWYLWPSGVPSPGAMRVWGQHAIAFVGRAHFDDPWLLQDRFTAAAPESVRALINLPPAVPIDGPAPTHHGGVP